MVKGFTAEAQGHPRVGLSAALTTSKNIGTRASGVGNRRRDQMRTQVGMYASYLTTVLGAIPSKRNRNIATPYGKIQISWIEIIV